MLSMFSFTILGPPRSTLFPYTTLFRSVNAEASTRVQRLIALNAFLIEQRRAGRKSVVIFDEAQNRSEEHTSELQSHSDLVCRLLLEKKNDDEADHHRHDREHVRDHQAL